MDIRPIHVLVVDDDPAIRHMLGLALREAGHRVTVSDGGRLGRVDDVDVALIDLRLGDATARDLIVAVPALASIPLIVMTAGRDAGGSFQGLPALSAVVDKPFDLDRLDHAIRSAAGRGGQREASLRRG